MIAKIPLNRTELAPGGVQIDTWNYSARARVGGELGASSVEDILETNGVVVHRQVRLAILAPLRSLLIALFAVLVAITVIWFGGGQEVARAWIAKEP